MKSSRRWGIPQCVDVLGHVVCGRHLRKQVPLVLSVNAAIVTLAAFLFELVVVCIIMGP